MRGHVDRSAVTDATVLDLDNALVCLSREDPSLRVSVDTELAQVGFTNITNRRLF